MDDSRSIFPQRLQSLGNIDWRVSFWLREHFRPMRAKVSLDVAVLISIVWLSGVAFVACPVVYVAVRVAIAT